MGRFVSEAATARAFTTAKVFTTPGSSTMDVPPGVTKIKAYVVGAGSNYRTTEFCFRSSGCCSGVVSPNCNYCMVFTGHLTGAGGGYAEKTFDDVPSGGTITINVGSQGGLSASSVQIGTETVTATNASETTVTWNCISNSTARDNSNDNKVLSGFDLPVCGYCNSINGYFNSPGTASGGDINRTGGEGVIIPYFKQDSCLEAGTPTGVSAGTLVGNSCLCWGCTISGYDFTFGGTRFSCICVRGCTCGPCATPNGACVCRIFMWNVDCLCFRTYHTVFGSNCCSTSFCFCRRFRECLCNEPYVCMNGAATGGGGDVGIKYIFAGESTRVNTASIGRNSCEGAGQATNTCYEIDTCPIGIGATSGTSSHDGEQGTSEQQVQYFTPATGGVSVSTTSPNWSFACCMQVGGDDFVYVFGTNRSSCPWVGIYDFGVSGTSGSSGASKIKCYNIGFVRSDNGFLRSGGGGTIPLSTLKDENGGNVNDIDYGQGASETAATFGGGGNRINPTGGSGLVVIVY